MKIYFIRHGESVGNTKKLYFQPPDEPLSDAGKLQAKILAKRLKKVQIDEIITSDYTRAMQTGEILKKAIKKPIEHTPLLRERRGNSLYQGKSWNDPELSTYLGALKATSDLGFKEHDEETAGELFDRAEKFLKFVETRSATNIAIVSHGIFINVIAQLVIIGRENMTSQIHQHVFHHTWMSNTGITVFEEWEAGRWYMLNWNDHAHLI